MTLLLSFLPRDRSRTKSDHELRSEQRWTDNIVNDIIVLLGIENGEQQTNERDAQRQSVIATMDLNRPF